MRYVETILLVIRAIRGALYWIKESIRFIWVEDLVAVHHRDKFLGVAEVDDIMRIAWEHVHDLDVVTRDFEFDDLVCALFAFLD